MHAGMPHGHAQGVAILWAMVGGLTGALGLVAFYIALSRGGMGVSAAVSGLLAAAIPALVSSSLEGAPGAMRLAGFLLAGGAIWLIAAGDSPEKDFPEAKGGAGNTMGLAVFAGVAFGIYFVALKLSNPLGLVMPMTIARMSSVALCSVVLAGMAVRGRMSPVEPRSQNRDMGHPVLGGGRRGGDGLSGWRCWIRAGMCCSWWRRGWGGWMWRRCWRVCIRRERFCWRRGICMSGRRGGRGWEWWLRWRLWR